MEQTECIACQYGDHDNHVDVIHASPPGMLGGASCPCRGECARDPRRKLHPPVVPASSRGDEPSEERVRALWEALGRWQKSCVEPDRPGTYTQRPILSECYDLLRAVDAVVGRAGRGDDGEPSRLDRAIVLACIAQAPFLTEDGREGLLAIFRAAWPDAAARSVVGSGNPEHEPETDEGKRTPPSAASRGERP